MNKEKIRNKGNDQKETLLGTVISERIQLNISGEIYETRINTLERFPRTLLGNRNKRSKYYCTTSRQYFFQRSRVFFDAILSFYQSYGLLQCPQGIPLDLFEEECRFFEIPEDAIVNLGANEVDISVDGDEHEIISEMDLTAKTKIWRILQHPETSSTAKYFAIFSMLMISLSVICSCLETLPSLKIESNIIESNYWSIIELCLNTWFLIELTADVICAPNRKAFFKMAMTWVDIVAVIPYFIVLAISNIDIYFLCFLRIVRLIRVCRLFRLSKQSAAIKLVAKVLTASMEDFKTLFTCLIVLVILEGSFMYHIESYARESHFTDILMGAYWSIQTITTLGYGDIHPQTIGGMVLACTFIATGGTILRILVSSIVAKFAVVFVPGARHPREER